MSVPRHVAIIMDGNGRWARARGMPRIVGHRAGAGSVRAVLHEALAAGVEQLTLYSFSSENWKRPAAEVSALMELCAEYVRANTARLVKDGVRFRVIGRRAGLPEDVREEIDRAEAATASGTRATLCLALNYGSRQELADAARAVAERAVAGELACADIDEAAVERELYTAGMPEPDLLIRTAGEMRISNFLLWQISYAELYVTDVCWPEFGAEQFREALASYAARTRRYGAIVEAEVEVEAARASGHEAPGRPR